MDEYPHQGSKIRVFFNWFLILMPLVLGIAFLIRPILSVINLLISIVNFILTGTFLFENLNQELFRSIFLLISAVFIFVLSIVILFPFVLPITKKEDLKSAWYYFWKFITVRHGSFLIIKDGKICELVTNLKKKKPAVVIADINSAFSVKQESNDKASPKIGDRAAWVSGQGVHFLRNNESLVGTIDLRNQIRYLEAEAQTKDGISLRTRLFIIFSVGQSADEILLTFIGEKENDLRIVEIGEKSSKYESKLVIKNIRPCEELDQEDRREIFTSYKRWLNNIEIGDFDKDQRHKIEINGAFISPYNVIEERVQAAVEASNKIITGIDAKSWNEIPVVTVEKVFRKHLVKVNYDALFLPDEPDKNYLLEFRKDFHIAVRNQGVIDFRIIQSKNNRSLEIGDEIDEINCFITPMQSLRNPKPLRNVGIKVILAGFSDLIPDMIVQKRILEYWQAKGEGGFIDSEYQKGQEKIISDIRKVISPPLSQDLNNEEEVEGLSKAALVDQLIKDIDETVANTELGKLLTHETKSNLWQLRKFLFSVKENNQNNEPIESSSIPPISI